MFSVAIPSNIQEQVSRHLTRNDGQEDLCFLIWHPSQGKHRTTAVVHEVVWPKEGDRQVHGNVSFNADYFMRACDAASAQGGGIALIHSHPSGTSWQGLSEDDFNAESRHAGRAKALTGLPMIGLTLATGDETLSARRWERVNDRTYEPRWASNVRVVGDRFRSSRPVRRRPSEVVALTRSFATWGEEVQQSLDDLHVGVVGAGSVGMLVVEALARIGVGHLTIIDFDTVKERNLDRLTGARRLDALLALSKASVAGRSAEAAATNPSFECTVLECSVLEAEGLAAAMDCDILFSCVDRPAGRSSLNALAYAHCIPVVDGGVLVDSRAGRLRSAQWRSHIAAPGRRCLECLEQYDPAQVQADRDGLLDDPTYLAQLPEDHVLRRGENVFAFSSAAASGEVLALLRMMIAPGGYADAGARHEHFTTGDVDVDVRGCNPGCPYDGMTGLAQASQLPIVSGHVTAELERSSRRDVQRTLRIRTLRRLDDALRRGSEELERFALSSHARKDR